MSPLSLSELEKGLKDLNETGFNCYTGRFLNPNSERRIIVRCRLEKEILAIKNARLLEEQIVKEKEEMIGRISHIIDIEDCQREQEEQIEKLQTDLEQVKQQVKQEKIVVYNYNYNFYQYNLYVRKHKVPLLHGSNSENRLVLFNKNRGI